MKNGVSLFFISMFAYIFISLKIAYVAFLPVFSVRWLLITVQYGLD